jgi:diacylglycerol kinase family enzyme
MDDGDSRKHLFVINPKSFPRKGELEGFISQVEKHFSGGRVSGHSYHISRYPRDAISVVRKYLSSVQPEAIVRVYAVGGDGIAFDCLNGIVGLSNAELAIMPYGGGSDFVRAFGDEHYDEFKDIELQTAAPAIPTDIIHCGSNYALNFCTVGMEAASVILSIPLNKRFEKARSRFPGLTGFFYALGGFMGAFNKNLIGQYYNLRIDGEDFSGRYNVINIANGPCYGAGKSAVTTAVPDDGILDIMIVQKTGSLKILRLQSAYLRGEYYKHPRECMLRRAKKVSIRSGSPLMVNLDGEVFFDSHITVEIVPRAVKIAAANNAVYRRRADFHG